MGLSTPSTGAPQLDETRGRTGKIKRAPGWQNNPDSPFLLSSVLPEEPHIVIFVFSRPTVQATQKVCRFFTRDVTM